MTDSARAQRDVDTARAALHHVHERHDRGQLGAADVDRAEARLDAALDRLAAAEGLPLPADTDLDGMGAIEAGYHDGAA